ncbi:MAG: hypothetical protein C5B49_15180 [Bdellovibrio sp.]|nr:MAG: hypothetical protein C5B49_15180 [Bdellovibrio sp.]
MGNSELRRSWVSVRQISIRCSHCSRLELPATSVGVHRSFGDQVNGSAIEFFVTGIFLFSVGEMWIS